MIDVGTFQSVRQHLFAVAYRMLGSASEAEDAVQDAWLPEPVPTGAVDTAEDVISRRESVTMAFLVLLETLSPAERAAFLLREVFDSDYSEVANVLDTTAVLGADAVGKLMIALAKRAAAAPGEWTVRLANINGEVALVGHHLGTLDSVFVCSTNGERITAIRAIRNPDKLRWLSARI